MTATTQVLTQAQREHFLTYGFVIIEGAYPRELCDEQAAGAWERLGYKADDPSTWAEEKIHMPSRQSFPFRVHAPRAFAAVQELMGADRFKGEPGTGNGFILNLRLGADKPWIPPSPEAGGWHKDGDFFRHFLDSPEQGLLGIVLWQGVQPKSGGTFIACDSIGVVARFLAQHPEGRRPNEMQCHELIKECKDFREVTGNTGDIALLHPFMLHASSRNPSGRPRFITNPVVQLKDPMQFNRPDGDYSLVEQGVLRGLGVASYDFVPTAPREAIVPARVAMQQKLKEEEDRRLAAKLAAAAAG